MSQDIQFFLVFVLGMLTGDLHLETYVRVSIVLAYIALSSDWIMQRIP